MDPLVLSDGGAMVILGPVDWGDSTDPYAGGSFAVEIRDDGMTATSRVFTFDFDRLDQFLAELADGWRGWTGTKTWRSAEDDLRIDATADSFGHVTLRFELGGVRDNWRASTQVTVDAGEDMSSLGQQIAALAGRR